MEMNSPPSRRSFPSATDPSQHSIDPSLGQHSRGWASIETSLDCRPVLDGCCILNHSLNVIDNSHVAVSRHRLAPPFLPLPTIGSITIDYFDNQSTPYNAIRVSTYTSARIYLP